jgi:hypothetical protein
MNRRVPITTGLEKRGRGTFFFDREAQNSSFVYLMKFNSENPRIRKAVKR